MESIFLTHTIYGEPLPPIAVVDTCPKLNPKSEVNPKLTQVLHTCQHLKWVLMAHPS